MAQEATFQGDAPPASLLRMAAIDIGVGEENVIQWAAILETNLYSTVESLRHVSAEEWAAMKIPMRMRTVGRRLAFPEEEGEQTIKSLLSQAFSVEDVAVTKEQKKKKKLSIGSTKSLAKSEARRSRSGSIIKGSSDSGEAEKVSSTPRDRLAEFRRSSASRASASHATGLMGSDATKRSSSTVHSLVSPPVSPQLPRKSQTRPKSTKMRRKSIDHSKDKAIRQGLASLPAVVHVAGDRGMVNSFLSRVDANTGTKGPASNLKEVTCSVPANGEMAKITFQASFSLMPDQLLEEAAMTVFVFSVLNPHSLNSLLLQVNFRDLPCFIHC